MNVNFYIFMIIYSFYKIYSRTKIIKSVKSIYNIDASVNIDLNENPELDSHLSNKYGKTSLILGLLIYAFTYTMYCIYSLYFIENSLFLVLTLSIISYSIFTFIIGIKVIITEFKRETYNFLKGIFYILELCHSMIVLAAVIVKMIS